MQEQEQNRTEQATPFKLSEAKKRGQVAKSLDFQFTGHHHRHAGGDGDLGKSRVDGDVRTRRAAARELRRPARRPNVSTVALLSTLASECGSILAPFLTIGVLAAVIANWTQSGPVFSGDPLKPDFARG